MNPLAHDPEMLTEFRQRVERGEWDAARRLGLALQLHRLDPQRLFERDDTYLCRLAARYAPPAERGRASGGAGSARAARTRSPRGRRPAA